MRLILRLLLRSKERIKEIQRYDMKHCVQPADLQFKGGVYNNVSIENGEDLHMSRPKTSRAREIALMNSMTLMVLKYEGERKIK